MRTRIITKCRIAGCEERKGSRYYLLILFSLLAIVVCSAIGIYAFLANEVSKVDVSAPDPGGPVIVPENYQNLLVLDIAIPPFDAGRVGEDVKLHNGVAGSYPRDILLPFDPTDWYSDHDGDMSFDGNSVSIDVEAIVSSDDDILDSGDTVKKTGRCLFESFDSSGGMGEQYIDDDRSESYTDGEAVVRTSTSSGEVHPGEIVRRGAAEMTPFTSNIRFTDGIDGNAVPAQYHNGEAIISSGDGILDSGDTVLTPGNADLSVFPVNILYSDFGDDSKYANEEAIIQDGGISGQLDVGPLDGTGTDAVLKGGTANLKPVAGQGLLLADDNGDNEYTPGELIVASADLSVDPGEVKLPGSANLRTMAGLSFADDNDNDQFDSSELIIENTGTRDNVLEAADAITSPGSADLTAFTAGVERFIDNNQNGVYNNGECIIRDGGIVGTVEPGDIEKPGFALLLPFSGENYLFTDNSADGVYTGDVDLTDGYQGEAIFSDANADGQIDNGELITAGYAALKSFPANVWFADSGNPGSGSYDSGEAVIISDDDLLSDSDTIVRSGSALFTAFDPDIKWADCGFAVRNTQYDDGELIVNSPDNILNPGEVVKPGYCDLKSLANGHVGEVYSDNDNSDTYTIGELIILSDDTILDAGDSVVTPGTACMISLQNSLTRFVDVDAGKDFDPEEAIVYDPNGNKVLDDGDRVAKSGTTDIKSLGDETVYMDHSGDGDFQGDTDDDVNWDDDDDTTWANDPDVINDQDEVILNDPIGANHLALDPGDSVMEPGMALLTVFHETDMYTDNDNGEYDGGASNEAIVRDNNSDSILDDADQIIVTGGALIRDFDNTSSTSAERFIDNNHDGTYTGNEAVWRDLNDNDLLDPGEIVKPGYAALIPLNDPPGQVKFTDDERANGTFDGDEAVVNDANGNDMIDPGEVITSGKADTVGEDRNRDGVITLIQGGEEDDLDNDNSDTPGSPYPALPDFAADHKAYMYACESMTGPVCPLRYIDANNDGIFSTDEVIIRDSSQSGLPDGILEVGALDGTGIDSVVTPGGANLTAFDRLEKYVDGNRNGAYDAGEAVVYDWYKLDTPEGEDILPEGEYILAGDPLFANGSLTYLTPAERENDRLTNRARDSVLLASLPGSAAMMELNDVPQRKYIDDDHSGTYDGFYAGSYEAIIWSENDQLDEGALDGTGTDHVIVAGYANLRPWTLFSVGLEYQASLDGKNISAGLRQEFANSGFTLSLNATVLVQIKGSEWRIDDWDNEKTYAIRKEGDKLNVYGSLKWTDDNHDNEYQGNEAIVDDGGDDDLITSIGIEAGDDKIIIPGDADLNDYSASAMKYVDADGSNSYDAGELVVNDLNQDDMVQNDEIIESGPVPFLQPFVSAPVDYRYCDSDRDNDLGSQEAIVIDTSVLGILESADTVVTAGYAGLTKFVPDPMFVDYNHDNICDSNEAIIYDDGNQILEDSDQIIAPGAAASFDGTSLKYAATSAGNPYTDGLLIVDDNGDDLVDGNEIRTSGAALLWDFSAVADRYADSDHDDQYDYSIVDGFGEAIVVNTTGNASEVESSDTIETDGYADLQGFSGTTYKYSDANRNDEFTDGELIINDLNSDYSVDAGEIIRAGAANLKEFPADVMYMDVDGDDLYSIAEAIIHTGNTILSDDDEVLASGAAGLLSFEGNTYRFADADHDDAYDTGEAIVVEAGWGTVDDILEDSDVVILAGEADIEQFPVKSMFLDDEADSDAYEGGEAIVDDSNGDNLLDPGEIITGGRAALRKFTGGAKYTDGGAGANTRNAQYDEDEAIVRDGNYNGKLDSGALDGTANDTVLTAGKAGFTQFDNDGLPDTPNCDDEHYVDADGNSQYDGTEDIYLDKDNNDILTMGDDALEYFVVENIGSATSSDLAAVNLWADRDDDGQFEPDTDDSPLVIAMIPDASNQKVWYEGPAIAPPLSASSAREFIGYTMQGEGQRFFVTVDTSSTPTDSRDIQMQIPLNGVKTVFGVSGPSDAVITNAYTQKIDFANPDTAEITSPTANAVFYGTVTLQAAASDTLQVGKVEFYIDPPGGGNTPIAVDDDGAPWEALWDSSTVEYGFHTLYARVYDRTYLRPPQTWEIDHYMDSDAVPVIVAISYTVQLADGWSLVSVPVEAFDPSLDSILSLIDGNCIAIWAYNATTLEWTRYDQDGPDFLNKLDMINMDLGYWFEMSGPGTLDIYGAMTETAVALQMGWNLVGCNSITPVDVIDAMASINCDFEIWTIDPETGEWLNYDPTDPTSNLDEIKPGWGYWIYVSESCVWDISL